MISVGMSSPLSALIMFRGLSEDGSMGGVILGKENVDLAEITVI